MNGLDTKAGKKGRRNWRLPDKEVFFVKMVQHQKRCGTIFIAFETVRTVSLLATVYDIFLSHRCFWGLSFYLKFCLCSNPNAYHFDRVLYIRG